MESEGRQSVLVNLIAEEEIKLRFHSKVDLEQVNNYRSLREHPVP
jgi:hypothetical protein